MTAINNLRTDRSASVSLALRSLRTFFMKQNFKFLTFIFLFLTAQIYLRPTLKLPKNNWSKNRTRLFESGKQREAINLINEYPEFSDEVEILYVKSVAYTELRDYKNADIAFQKGFDIFLKNGTESLAIADEYAAKTTSRQKRTEDLAALMYSTAMIMFASAELTNALRSVAFGKNGMPEEKREPKNLAGFDEFRKLYIQTAIKSGEMNFKNNLLKECSGGFYESHRTQSEKCRIIYGTC